VDATTLAFDQKRLDPNAVPVVAYLLKTPMGTRIWTQGVIPSAIAQNWGTWYDAEVPFDAEAYFDGGLDALEILPRIIGLDPLAQRSVPVGTDLLVALGEGERAGFAVTLANPDGALSNLLAEEYVLGAEGRVMIGYLGLDIADYIEKYRGKVDRWTIEGMRQVRLEHLEA